jgi:hypothetical protein
VVSSPAETTEKIEPTVVDEIAPTLVENIEPTAVVETVEETKTKIAE